ncbi:MAG TPA: prepilin peptidase [Patescibacteria group bacterium]|nr:prepilin peptidase [Patescibacteria group bacterium]
MIIAVLTVLGLCFGSFVNALVYRLHWQETHPKQSKKQGKIYSIVKGRSICPDCKHELAVEDLIPIFSWLSLGGRCRYCKKPVSWQYPLVETLIAFLFVVSYLFWPADFAQAENIITLGVWLICLVGFMGLIVYDLKYLILPNKIIFPLLGLAVVNVILRSAMTSSLEPAVSSFWGLMIGGGIFYVLFQVSNGSWIGGGDVKLGFLIGILIGGPMSALLMLFLASFLGTLYSVPLMLAKKVRAKSRIPFGPFLIISAIVVQLFGGGVIEWYERALFFSY